MLAYSNRTRRENTVYPCRNNRPLPDAPARHRGVLCTLAALVSLFAFSARAQELVAPQPRPQPPVFEQEEEDPGRFAIREARVELSAGVYFLYASIDYRLSTDARQALESGVPLTIRLEVELLNDRRFWFDNEDAALRQLYQLEYHALSERYIVQSLNSGDQASFSTLFAALNYLGRVDHLPLIDAALIDPDRGYDLRLRAVLDVEQFPGPLRLLAFWRRDWSLGSDWYRWRLQDD
jgi:hypothetical protein